MIKRVNTSRARPTNVKPSTRPPLNATLNAWPKLTVASFAVRTLALTAIYIPMYPERVEVSAPKKKGSVV